MRNSDFNSALKTNPILTRWFAFAGLIVLWIATRPYVGIVDDAQLYTFQAMAKLAPTKFSDDLFLKYGSQDKFTIYGYVLAFVISLIGIVKANFLMTVLGGALWLMAMAFLSCTLFPAFSYRVAAMWSVVILPSCYGATNLYAQQYQNPRLYCEAIVIISIAFALRRMWLRATVSLAVGLVVHPIIILYGFGTVFLLAAKEKRQLWLFPPLGIILLGGLAWFHFEPFSRIGYTMPPDWWRTVVSTDWADFLTRWSLPNYILILMQVNIGLLIYWLGPEIERRLLEALSIVVIVSLVTSVVGADWLHDLLIVNTQFYRATFLSSTLINMFSGILLLRMSKQSGTSRFYIMLSLALTAVDRYIPVELFLVCILLFLSSIFFWLESKTRKVSRFWALPLFALTVLICATTILMVFLEIKIRLSDSHNWHFFFNTALIAAACLCIVIFYRCNKLAASIILTAMLFFGLLNFDQRTPWQKFVESVASPPTPILALISASKNIYWESGRAYLWFNLQHTSYFSYLQCVGSMFYQGTANEEVRRSKFLSQLDTSDFANDRNNAFPKQDFDKNGPTSIDQVKDVCQDLPELDLIVLFTKVPDAQPVEWTAPVQQYSNQVNNAGIPSLMPETHYYFYQCRSLRNHVSKPFRGSEK